MTLLGKILRLDVRSTPPMGRTYAIPAGNPVRPTPVLRRRRRPAPCPEIWACGLRNPWRMAFDPQNGQLWLGDVGQATREEVDRVVAGGNYGWDCFEGDVAAPEHGRLPARPGLRRAGGGLRQIPAAAARRLARSPAASSTAARRSAGLAGHYLYADYYGGQIWALDTTSDDDPVLLLDTDLNIAAFGQGRDGAVYVVTHDSPSIYQLVPEPG